MRLSDDELRLIGDLYLAGYGERKISRYLGIGEDHVSNLLRGKTKAAQRVLGRLANGRRPQRQLAKGEIDKITVQSLRREQ